MLEARDRFTRIAWPRLDKFEAAATNLGKCSRARDYEFTGEEAAEVARRVTEAAQSVAAAFVGERVEPEPEPVAEAPAAEVVMDDDTLSLLRQAIDATEAGDTDTAGHLLAMVRANIGVLATKPEDDDADE